MRRPAVLAALLGVVVLVKRRGRAQQAERELWHVATTSSDPAAEERSEDTH